MTLQELWDLFPISLIDHKSEWEEWTVTEIDYLSDLLRGYQPVISHIGSTALPEIKAKPIIDILVEIPENTDLNNARSVMLNAGYICMSQSEKRLSFNKGYTPQGYAEKVFHIHFHYRGDNDEIAFRDFLLSHHDSAKEYETLKISLLARYRNNRDGYTKAKSDFVRQILLMAKQ